MPKVGNVVEINSNTYGTYCQSCIQLSQSFPYIVKAIEVLRIYSRARQ